MTHFDAVGDNVYMIGPCAKTKEQVKEQAPNLHFLERGETVPLAVSTGTADHGNITVSSGDHAPITESDMEQHPKIVTVVEEDQGKRDGPEESGSTGHLLTTTDLGGTDNHQDQTDDVYPSIQDAVSS
ncbi:hypothetical protein Bbelb_143780 [Branchiostoma belcheri]|nr:hypothetical protein Bbelb_143780 [Branchiostoma belcheri]